MKVNRNYQEFHHPRLTSVYDLVNSVDGYLGFYKEFVSSIRAKNIVDFGCRTGLLTSELGEHADSIIGIDSSRGLIKKAREKYKTTKIDWEKSTHTISSEEMIFIFKKS